MNDMIIGIASTKRLETFTIFQSGGDNGVKIWVFHVTDEVIVQRYVPVVKILF